jgi:sortase A
LSVALLLAGAALVVSMFVPKFWVPSPTLEGDDQGVSQVSNTVGEQDKKATEGAESTSSGGSLDVAPESPGGGEKTNETVRGPEDKTLTMSIPKMGRVEKDSVPNAVGDDQPALKKNVAIHLKGTGYPWQKEANVYLAGHRIGYPGTDSFLGFYDLNKLEKGDEIKVSDADGERYAYKVYRQEVVRPSNMSVTEPIDGRNILTLQTCTLPNYKQRLIVQAEKVA